MSRTAPPLAIGCEQAAVTARTWIGFAAMAVGLFMAILDMQIVATSLPTIQTALGVSPDQMSWVQTAYIAAEVISIPITGLLTRALGLRGLFLISVVLFTATSIGCAASPTFAALVAWRVVQGFAAGALIPLVFSAVFLLFPPRLEPLATSLAGVLGVLAPTLGPIIGGYITHALSWHWLFLINVGPGIAAALLGWSGIPRLAARPALLRRVDLIGLALLAAALTSLIIGLKRAPDDGWDAPLVLGLFAAALVAGWLFLRRARVSPQPVVALDVLADRRTAVGCVLNFAFGMSLFGSVYLMPVFLALVRGHDSLQIGEIMLVTGVAQVVAAPVAVWLEKRTDPRWLSAFGLIVFAIGLAMSGWQTKDTDYGQMFWPQVVRGVAVMFCILPPTRLALGHLPLGDVPNASGLFNVMRNIGGAIGLALVDTVVYGRAPGWGDWIVGRLGKCDTAVASAVGIPLDDFRDACGQPVDPDTRDLLAPMVKKLALVYAIDEAWLMLAAIVAVACLVLWWLRRRKEA